MTEGGGGWVAVGGWEGEVCVCVWGGGGVCVCVWGGGGGIEEFNIHHMFTVL